MISTLKKFYRISSVQRSRTKLLEQLDFGQRPNQYFLISYPKSGNTWMRMLLANLSSDGCAEINLKNVGDYVPDHQKIAQVDIAFKPDSLFSSLPYQFIKTHDPYYSYYRDKQVIYIVRDGRDVLNSYYHYLNAHRQNPIKLMDIISWNKSVPMGTWSNHVLGWANKPCRRKIILRYEDMLTNTKAEMQKLLDWLSWKPSNKSLEKAIEASSFEELKYREEKYGWFDDSRANKDNEQAAFFRKGEARDWENLFTDADLATFWQHHAKGMCVFDYHQE